MKREFTILDHTATLVVIDKRVWGRDAYGDFEGDDLTIRIKSGLSRDVFIPTLLHELTHMKQHLFGKPMDEDEANQDALFYYSFMKDSALIDELWLEYSSGLVKGTEPSISATFNFDDRVIHAKFRVDDDGKLVPAS